jgi:hypothetical protein
MSRELPAEAAHQPQEKAGPDVRNRLFGRASGEETLVLRAQSLGNRSLGEAAGPFISNDANALATLTPFERAVWPAPSPRSITSCVIDETLEGLRDTSLTSP